MCSRRWTRPLHREPRSALRCAARLISYLDSPIVFDDPVAVPILGSEYAEQLRRTPLRPDRPFSTALRAFVVGRSRYAEDNLKRAAGNGVKQYVLLGAGLDTFAYRNRHPQLRVFEVDHPATQQWKRELLQRSRIAIPESLSYTPWTLNANHSQSNFVTLVSIELRRRFSPGLGSCLTLPWRPSAPPSASSLINQQEVDWRSIIANPERFFRRLNGWRMIRSPPG